MFLSQTRRLGLAVLCGLMLFSLPVFGQGTTQIQNLPSATLPIDPTTTLVPLYQPGSPRNPVKTALINLPGGGGGSGNVTTAVTLTTSQLIVGAGSTAVGTLGTLGTASTVLHGNAVGLPTWSAVNLASDVTGTLPGASVQQFGSANSGIVPASGGSTTAFLRADGNWIAPAGSGGNVTTSVVLTANRIVLGNATSDLIVLGSLGTATSLLHGNASGAPTFSAVNLAADVTGVLPGANVQTFGTANAGAVPASGGGTTSFLRADGTWAAPSGGGNVNAGGTLTSNALIVGSGSTNVAALASLGTTTTLLHGNAAGLPTFGQVNLASDITGTLPAANLPNPTASTLGGIESFAAVANQWIKSISTSGVPASTQPTFADISGTITSAQCPLATTGAFGCVKPDGSSITVTAGVIAAPGSGGGTVGTGTQGQIGGYFGGGTTTAIQGYTLGSTFTVDNTAHTVIMTTPDSTKSADYTFAGTDMGGTVNLTGTHNLTFPAVSAGPPPIWGTGQIACYSNIGVGNWTVITTPTINGLPSTTIFPGGGGCVVSNGTSLDWQPGKAGDEARYNAAGTFNSTQTFLTSIKFTGSGSGTITEQVQAAAGTYNWNLPTTAGSSGQPLLSGGGGSTAMSFGTLGVAGGGLGIASGTSGGVVCFTGSTTAASSAALAANNIVLGGGAGACPTASTALPNGTTATTQSAADNSTKAATTAYVDRLTTLNETLTASWRTPVSTPSISTATFTPNFDTGSDFIIVLVHASCPCTIANPSTTPVAGQHGMLYVVQSSTGSDTVGTWGSQYLINGGVAGITLSSGANAIDAFSYAVKDSTHIVLSAPALAVAH